MRTFEQTHPWITFALDLRQGSYKLWLMLGEAISKCEHISNAPLLPEVAEELYQVYLAKGVMATTAIEGNTLTEKEILQRLEGKLELPPSKEYLGQEVDNMIEACNQTAGRILAGKSTQLSFEEITQYNELVLKNLPLEDHVERGAIRKQSVGVGRYRGAPHEDCEYLLRKMCEWLNEKFEAPDETQKMAFGILKAIVAHIYIAWIHPFGDGNGRTARLIEFKILLGSGVPMPSAQLLSNHYNQTRSEYYRQLDEAHKSNGNIFPFIEYALQGFVDQLKNQIELIQRQQYEVHWRNFVYDQFKDKHSETSVRRRRLAIDLSTYESVTVSKVRHISPRIAEAYATKTNKTLTRDINALRKMGLVRKTPKGVRIRRDQIFKLLPSKLDA
jgi:Fic family protein